VGDLFTQDGLRAAGFSGFKTFPDLLGGKLAEVPQGPGTYVVLRGATTPPSFLPTSRGGRFKGRDPVVEEAILRGKWVDGCHVVYIGKAVALQRRLRECARFGNGEPVGHWGGRYIWQLADAQGLLVAWRPVRPQQRAVEAEAELLTEFKRRYGAPPFANIAGPSRRKRGVEHPNARPNAERALVSRFVQLTRQQPDGDGRLPELRPLIVQTVKDAPLAQCINDISRGDGRELEWSKHPDRSPCAPSLYSAYSSCGAALNHFGAWRLAPQTLHLVGETNFTELRLEEKLRIFRGGKAPNLDCVLWDDDRIIAVESKLCEHLAPGHSASFAESYDPVAPLVDESWRALYELLKNDDDHFTYLDAAQLVRHYFGVRAQLAQGRRHAGKRAWLVYSYWEPTDANTQPVCLAHRCELAELQSLVADPAVCFLAVSHRDLWSEWETRETPPWLGRHVQLLRHRYDVSLSTSGSHL
jgi:hypothetical protein